MLRGSLFIGLLAMQCHLMGYSAPCWHANVEALLVKPCYADTAIASTVDDTLTGSTTIRQGLHTDWDPGVRASVGFTPPGSCVELSVQGTYIRMRNRGTVELGTHTQIIPELGLFPIDLVLGNTGRTTTTLKHDYTLLDAVAAYPLYCLSCAKVSPYVGFRGFWWLIRREEINFSSNGINYAAEGTPSSLDQPYLGFGAVAGLKLEAEICHNFLLFGSFAGARVSGTIKETTVSQSTVAGQEFVKNASNDLCLSPWCFEGKIGVAYENCLCGKPLQIGLSYEYVSWRNECLTQENPVGWEWFAYYGAALHAKVTF